MKATKDHSRVSPQGREVGAMLVRMVEPAIADMVSQGEPDTRCASCAFRAGTVPNGCMQTMADAVKSVIEQKPFHCHVKKYADGTPDLCHGWLGAIWSIGDRPPGVVPWEFTPPDEATP